MAVQKKRKVMPNVVATCLAAVLLVGPGIVAAQPPAPLAAGSGQGMSTVRGSDSVDQVLSGAGPTGGVSIQAALQAAMDNNPKFLSRKAAYAAAHDSYLKSFAGLLPQLDFTAAGGYKFQRSDTTITRYTSEESEKLTNEQRLTLSQLIYDGGVVSSKADADMFAKQARQEEIYSTAEDVGLTATQYFFEVIRNRGVVSLCEANIAEHERITELTKVRESNGGGTLADVKQAEAALADAKSRLVQAQQNLADAEAGYAQFFGTKPGELALPGQLTRIVPQSAEMAASIAAERHKSLKAAQFGIQQKDKEIAAAKGVFMPDIRAKLSAGRSDNTSGYVQSYHDASGMLVFNFNLFSGGADTASLSKARNAKLQAEREAEDLKRAVEHDAKVAFNFYKATGSLLPILRENVDTNAQVVSGYMDQFRMGKRTLLDLVSAQNSLFSAQQVYLNGLTAHNFSFYRIGATSSNLMPALGINLKVDAAAKN